MASPKQGEGTLWERGQRPSTEKSKNFREVSSEYKCNILNLVSSLSELQLGTPCKAGLSPSKVSTSSRKKSSRETSLQGSTAGREEESKFIILLRKIFCGLFSEARFMQAMGRAQQLLAFAEAMTQDIVAEIEKLQILLERFIEQSKEFDQQRILSSSRAQNAAIQKINRNPVKQQVYLREIQKHNHSLKEKVKEIDRLQGQLARKQSQINEQTLIIKAFGGSTIKKIDMIVQTELQSSILAEDIINTNWLMDNTFDLEPASEDEEISHTLTRQDIFMDSTSVPTATDCVNDRFRLCNAQEDTLNLSSLSVIPTRYLSTIEEMSTELTMAYEKINNLTSDVQLLKSEKEVLLKKYLAHDRLLSKLTVEIGKRPSNKKSCNGLFTAIFSR